jgi:hypothetical protein
MPYDIHTAWPPEATDGHSIGHTHIFMFWGVEPTRPLPSSPPREQTRQLSTFMTQSFTLISKKKTSTVPSKYDTKSFYFRNVVLSLV